MPMWEIVLGGIIIAVAATALVAGVAALVQVTIEDAETDAAREAARLAHELAQQEYEDMLANTTYRVRFGMRIVDEMEKGENHE